MVAEMFMPSSHEPKAPGEPHANRREAGAPLPLAAHRLHTNCALIAAADAAAASKLLLLLLRQLRLWLWLWMPPTVLRPLAAVHVT